MKTIKQLLRQPLKTVIGITLMILAAATVYLCVGQAMAAKATEEALNRRFSSVGLPTVQEDANGWIQLSSYLLEEELTAWLEKTAADHPDIVRGISKSGILSAYIPELTPYNPTTYYYEGPVVNTKTEHYGYRDYMPLPFNMPYSCAMLVITLEEIGEPDALRMEVIREQNPLQREDFSSQAEYNEYYNALERLSAVTGYEVQLVGTVTEVVALEEGYRCSAGRTARLTLNVPSLEALEALALIPGQQYIVYGMDFVDEHGKLVDWVEGIGRLMRGTMEPYAPALLKIEVQEKPFVSQPVISISYAGANLSESQYAQLNTISMSLYTPASLLQFEEVRGEDGYLQALVEKDPYSVTDASGQTHTVTKAEYNQRYQVPTIARLEGSVGDFLDSQEGAIWKAALERTEINNHAFAVIGVEHLAYLSDFSLGHTRIVEGREFTLEERESGAKVCILQEAVAAAQGLQIGDTITLNLYATDPSLPYQAHRTGGNGILNPAAAFYFGTTPFVETAEYTIVGFYRGEGMWPDPHENPYGFSANTVFVPKSSVQTPMEECSSILMNTLVLQNGKIEAFQELAAKAGYAGRFRYHDQDYSTIAANFHNYDGLSQQMLTVGALLYSLLLLLFLLLYPGAQRKNVRRMQALGTGYLRRFWHVLISSLGIVIPGSLLGGWLGNQLWDRLVAALQASAESAVALQLQPEILATIGGLQVIFAFVLVLFTALLVAIARPIPRRG